MIKLSELIKKQQYIIYCDMDGVLTDFERQLKKIGIDDGFAYEDKYGTKAFWEEIGKYGLKWWSEMPWMPDGKKLWNFIKDKNVKILSAPARTLSQSKKGKEIWVKKNLGNVELILRRAQNKKEFADSTSILIDDMEKNVNQWKSAGGIGILHKNAADTINKLKSIINENVIKEFKEDLKKQCVVLMGLPAAGKSTFVEKDIKKYIPRFGQFNYASSDTQVLAAQYRYAKSQYEWLLNNIHNKKDLKQFIDDSVYTDNNGNKVKHPITYRWWEENKDKGFNKFYKTFYKPFYATYFDIRDMAKRKAGELFKTKIQTAGDVLVIESIGVNPKSILHRLNKTKENDFNNTIIYLDIDVDLSIRRDLWRKKTQGRSVGEVAIKQYSTMMDKSFNTYKSYGERNPNGVLDRLLHFKWKPTGNSPIDGHWVLINDYKFFLNRKRKND